MNQSKFSLKDFFLNLGAVISLYLIVGSLINLLFTVINKAYPQISSYNYYYSSSISWPVSMIVILFPVFILLMWLLEKSYNIEPERKNSGIHRWLTYITLFLSGGILVGDLITILYYFIDGQELTTGFLLKILVLSVIMGSIFIYYVSDLRDKLTGNKRTMWRIVALVVVMASIVWGFSVLGSPRTQRFVKYDEQKVNDLSNIKSAIESYYSTNGTLPNTLDNLNNSYYYYSKVDSQTQKPYEYQKTGDLTYKLCAEFNKKTDDKNNDSRTYYYGIISWKHPSGHHCFDQTINPNLYTKPVPLR